MPCESCRVQFTVFRRKKSCVDCKRYYCSSCLSTVKRNISGNNNVHFSSTDFLCDRCAVFAKRPLLRTDLLQLKPKDLIFYLQSKHVSTTGCVEKEELVGLVLNHVQQVDNLRAASTGSVRSNTSDPTTSSFDSLKQTCQNFFSNITENISDSFSAFDNKATPKGTGQGRTRHGSTDNTESSHIFDQPRVSTREIPTYASFQSGNGYLGPATASNDTSIRHNLSPITIRGMTVKSATESAFTSHNAEHLDDTKHIAEKTDTSLTIKTPPSLKPLSTSYASVSEPYSQIRGVQLQSSESGHKKSQTLERAVVEREEGKLNYDCECSDDELIVTYSGCAMSNRIDGVTSQKETLKPLNGDVNASGPSITSMSTNTDSGTCSGSGSGGYKVDLHGGEISSQSSFEELGAIGGISDDSKAATDTNSSNLDQWQMLDNTTQQSQGSSLDFVKEDNKEANLDRKTTISVPAEEALQLVLLYEPNPPLQPSVVPQRVKKVTRRRSDSYLNRQRQHPGSEDDSPTQSTKCRADAFILPEDEVLDLSPVMHQTGGASCYRCGKHKSNLRRQVEKMRSHLESSQMSEADIKLELQAFLAYLEKRSKSIECSDAETVTSSLGGTNCAQMMTPTTSAVSTPVQQQRQRRHQFQYFTNDNDGIHVYAPSLDIDAGAKASRFINLNDFDSLVDLESLSVKQLKEVLMLNRVDYKGCCEKQELLERVERLWKNLKSAPAIDKLQTDELCKICMDAPIECVILECGHMATCTNCGKVLSECPICRQYIVRVVRFFRA